MRKLYFVAALLLSFGTAYAQPVSVGPMDYRALGTPNGPAQLDSSSTLSSNTVTPTGSTTARTLANRTADVINVMDYGAKCDNSTDDAAAINAAITQVRTMLALSARSGVTLALPRSIPGSFRRCVVNSTLNFTGIIGGTPNGVIFEGNGTTIYSNVTGAPIIDALGSNHIHWNELKVQSTNNATYGIQIGRTITTATDYGGGSAMRFTDMDIEGIFTIAGFYNFAGEEVMLINPKIANSIASATAYAYVADGFNHFNITSAFVTQTAPVDTAQSFEETTIVGGSFATVGAGAVSPIWLGAVTQHRFINSYFVNLTGTSCVTLYNASAGIYFGIKGLDLDIHCESTGLTNIFLVAGTLTAPIMRDLTFREVYEFSTGNIFAMAGSTTSVVLEHPKINISGGPASPTFAMFDTPSKYTLTGGEVYVYSAAPWANPPGNLTADVTIPGGTQRTAGQLCAAPGPLLLSNVHSYLSDAHCITTLGGTVNTTTTPVRLTTDQAAAGATNCINSPTDGSIGSLKDMSIDIVARDRTITTNTVVWHGYQAILNTPSTTLASTTVSAGTKPTPISTGTVTGTDVTLAADTTNGCLNLTWTPPTSNTDLWDVVASVRYTQAR